MSIYIPYIAISLVAIAIVAFLVIWKFRHSGHMRRDTDYRAFFWIGLAMMIFGGPALWLADSFSYSGVFGVGLVFFIMGLANRDKWGKKRTLKPEAVRNKLIAIFAGVIMVVLAGIYAFALFL
ncbi:MAG: hypothetical protein JXC85_02440 [Candidatus Aenigmarchaeota archaeon]|nr:hypothetical protein [Candidatus Aenigmarchaeota archaeon]